MPRPLSWYNMEMPLADISTASQVRFLVTQDGYLRRVECTIAGTIATLDSVITVSHNNTALSPTITVTASGSAEGDYDSAEYFRPVKRGDWIEVATGGESSNVVTATINAVFSP